MPFLLRDHPGAFTPAQASRHPEQILTELHQTNVRMYTRVTLLCAFQGGNDYEIYCDPRTIGHEVSSPEETHQLCQEIFFSWLQIWPHGDITISHFKPRRMKVDAVILGRKTYGYLYGGVSFWQKLSWPGNVLLSSSCYSWFIRAELHWLFSPTPVLFLELSVMFLISSLCQQTAAHAINLVVEAPWSDQ